MKQWHPNSWHGHPAKHIPDYPDKEKLEKVEKTLLGFPPLVFAGEVRSLRRHLAEAAEGSAFLLQGGDCAESFADFNPNNI